MRTLLSICLLASASLVQAAEPTTVAHVDVARYMGTWHEIARLPMYFQKDCVSDVQANYALNPNGSISVLNSCRRADGKKIEAHGLATSVDASNSKLRVSFLPKAIRWLPFGQSPYWILRLDEHYQTVLVGTPNHQYLWILSRSPKLDAQVYRDYVNTAKNLGYDVSKLIHNP